MARRLKAVRVAATLVGGGDKLEAFECAIADIQAGQFGGLLRVDLSGSIRRGRGDFYSLLSRGQAGIAAAAEKRQG
ncbi:hypothetical protein EKH55_4643 [Sinorhizobium alkalisoli]|nr:hypothetical protein EKH55_4643 [Sinorhizobium alkalisoli]